MSQTYKIGDMVRNKRTGRIAEVSDLPRPGQDFLRVFIVWATGYKERRAWSLNNIEIVNSNNNLK